MNQYLDYHRISAGISRLTDDPRLVVINKEGDVIDPLIGLQLYGEAVVKDCLVEIHKLSSESGDTQKIALSEAMLAISKKFGVYEW
jgi:hypothetical protein